MIFLLKGARCSFRIPSEVASGRVPLGSFTKNVHKENSLRISRDFVGEAIHPS